MNPVVLGVCLAGVITALAGLGYRLGLRHGLSCLLPWEILEELARHKVVCCREDPPRVIIELMAHLQLSREEAELLVKRVTPRRERAA